MPRIHLKIILLNQSIETKNHINFTKRIINENHFTKNQNIYLLSELTTNIAIGHVRSTDRFHGIISVRNS